MSNIFDVERETQQFLQPEPQTKRSPVAGFIASTITLALIAVIAPVYIHVLVKIATWSWNLI
jgi:hypothetical protein